MHRCDALTREVEDPTNSEAEEAPGRKAEEAPGFKAEEAQGSEAEDALCFEAEVNLSFEAEEPPGVEAAVLLGDVPGCMYEKGQRGTAAEESKAELNSKEKESPGSEVGAVTVVSGSSTRETKQDTIVRLQSTPPEKAANAKVRLSGRRERSCPPTATLYNPVSTATSTASTASVVNVSTTAGRSTTETTHAETARLPSYANINAGIDVVDVATATLVDEDDKKGAKAAVCLAVVLLLTVAAIVVPVVVTGGQSNSNPDNSAIVIGEQKDEALASHLADVPEDICFDRVPGQGKGLLCSLEETSKQGGGVANLVAYARLVQLPSADLSLLNAGEVRSDIHSGSFTEEDLLNLLPFDNELLTIDMTGNQISQALEEALEYIVAFNKTGAYPYTAGLRFEVDYRKDFPNRTAKIEYNSLNFQEDITKDSWEPLVASQEYRVLTTSFIIGGGDGYLVMTAVDPTKIRETFVSSLQAFRDYAFWQGDGLIDPDPSRYSTSDFHPGLFNFTAL